jgi:hypothetical protein
MAEGYLATPKKTTIVRAERFCGVIVKVPHLKINTRLSDTSDFLSEVWAVRILTSRSTPGYQTPLISCLRCGPIVKDPHLKINSRLSDTSDFLSEVWADCKGSSPQDQHQAIRHL